MSRKRAKRDKRSRFPRKQVKKWELVLDSKEATLNLYSVLISLQQTNGRGLIDKKAVKYVKKWVNTIVKHVPDIQDLAKDTRGPFRERDTSPLNLSLSLNLKERVLMLFICRFIYKQLLTPKGRKDWIENFGQKDYEFAVKNYEEWINSLEGDDMHLI